MYGLLKSFLFKKNPEEAHYWAMNNLSGFLSNAYGQWLVKKYCGTEKYDKPVQLWGLNFKNIVGLAAGFDKNAQYIDELAALGFGFIEIGTLTPKAQPGNDQPRLFRIVEDEGLINRMGFNNEGVDDAVKRLERRQSSIIIGGNIGKNKITPNEDAVNDYVYCLNKLHDVVDYFVVNVSSPNTPNLRELQEKEPLKKILFTLQDINQGKSKPKPILLKIAPDLTTEQLNDIIEIVTDSKIQGLVATNTTIDRSNLKTSPQILSDIGAGGVSGLPVKNKSTDIISYIHKNAPSIPIIGVGGIFNSEDAKQKLDAGASLLQIYSGFIYEGPNIVKKILKGL